MLMSKSGFAQIVGLTAETKKGGTQGENLQEYRLLLLGHFTILARNPANLRIDYDGMPAVFGSSDPFKGRAVLYGGDAAILCVVARTNVNGAAAAHDADLLDGGLAQSRLNNGYRGVPS